MSLTKNKFFTNVNSKILAGLGILAVLAALVGAGALFDDRYAIAANVKQTQAQMVQSIRLLNVNVELVTLENRQFKLRAQKRDFLMQLQRDPNNITLKMLLDGVTQDLDRINHRIGELENKRITE